MGALVASASLAVAVFLLVLGLASGNSIAPVWRNWLLGRTDENEQQRGSTEVLRTTSLFERFALAPSNLFEPSERLMMVAGVSDRINGRAFIGMSVGAACGMALLWLMVSFGSLLMLGTPVAALLGGGAPYVLFNGRANRRREAVERALPDMLDLLTVSIEAGLALEASLSRVAERGDGPLHDEIRRTLSEIGLGRRRRDALQTLGERTGVQPVVSLVNAMNQADRSGMQLGPVLRSQSQQIRERRRQRAEEAAMKAPLKMLLPLVGFIFPAMFVVILGPAVLNVMAQF
jgi:tight adherence protein C